MELLLPEGGAEFHVGIVRITVQQVPADRYSFFSPSILRYYVYRGATLSSWQALYGRSISMPCGYLPVVSPSRTERLLASPRPSWLALLRGTFCTGQLLHGASLHGTFGLLAPGAKALCWEPETVVLFRCLCEISGPKSLTTLSCRPA